MPSPSTLPWQRSLLICGNLVLVGALLYFAPTVFVPLVMAILFTFVLGPSVSALQRRGLGRIPSVILVVLLAFSLIGAVGFGCALQLKSLVTDLPQFKDNIMQKFAALTEVGNGSWLDNARAFFKEIAQKVEHLLGPADVTESEPLPVRIVGSNPLTILQKALTPALELLVNAGLVIVLVIFMLVQREDLRNRLIRLWGSGNLTRTTRALDDAGRRISRFLLMQLIVNGTYGLVFGLGLRIIGVPYALLWGFLAAMLRYIPYLGAWVSATLPIILSIAVFPGWTQPLAVIGLVAVLELVSNNFMEPWLYGQSVGVSEVALLIAAAFWTWMWGPIGLVLSTPLTACLVVLGRYVPQLEFFSILLGDEPALEPHVRLYQRLLARDEDEAEDLLEEYAKTHPVEEVYDQVLLPALVMAKRNRERGELTAEDEQFIFQTTRDLLDDLVLSQEPTQPAAENSHGTVNGPPSQPVLILGCPARDKADELALYLFRELLASKCTLKVLSTAVIAAEVIARVKEEAPSLVIISSLPPEGIAHTRYLCKRLRAQFPDLKIAVGCWGHKENLDRTADKLKAAGADQVAATLVESRDLLLPWIQVLSYGKETAAAK